jgi:hypothetical protein
MDDNEAIERFNTCIHRSAENVKDYKKTCCKTVEIDYGIVCHKRNIKRVSYQSCADCGFYEKKK